MLVGCGGGSSVTGPSEAGVESQTPRAQRNADLPPNIYGAFTASYDVPEAAANGGNVVLIVPSYADDASIVASALRSNGKVAILSAHHVFGNPEATWEQGWAQTKKWAEPFADLIAAVYVIDEPGLQGISSAVVGRAIARVRADGFRTAMAEGVDVANPRGYARPPVDLFGATCYMWPGEGSWSMDRCEEAYRTHPEWNLVIGQGFDIYEGNRGSKVWNGTVEEQVARWVKLGRERSGVVFWTWRWPGQLGIGDDPSLRAAYNREGGR